MIKVTYYNGMVYVTRVTSKHGHAHRNVIILNGDGSKILTSRVFSR